MRNLESGQQRKEKKQMPKWQFLNQAAKILPLQTSQLQTLYFRIARTDSHWPKSPNKKVEVIQRLLTKCKLRINLKEN